jgi:5-formyltetrahydrofolate cyclo-ligase
MHCKTVHHFMLHRIRETDVSRPAPFIESAKVELRRDAAARRDALPAATRKAAAAAIAARAFPLPVSPGIIVSGFMPLKSEINPLPLMKTLADAGATLALPKIAGRGKPLIMRAWQWGAPLEAGQWGIREPKADASEVDPDIILVPLLGFDRAGRRIGYGAGYYDMTIARLRSRKTVTAVGIAFATQEVPAVPATERDARLDLVLTEREVIEIKG